MKTNPRELRSQREDLLKQAIALVDGAEDEKRDFSAAEQTKYDGLLAEAEALLKRAERAESMTGLESSLASGKAPATLRIGRGDSEIRALAHFVRTGDRGGVGGMAFSDQEGGGRPMDGVIVDLPRERSLFGAEMRAVVDSTMNITTAADGGALVPTGFSGAIAKRRNEVRLSERLQCTNIPGKGTTVNYPVEAADPEVLATTAEQDDAHAQNYERDAGAVGTKAFTLVKKTKKVELTEEITDDEDVGLLDFLADRMGRNIGKTHNSMLLVEVAANGTSLKTFAAAAAIAAGEPEAIVGNDALGYYLDDAGRPAWVTRNPTIWAIRAITGNPRLYAGAQEDGLLGYDVLLSSQSAAVAASAKSVYFGDWTQVGFREDPALRIIRDPYSVDGLVIMKYSFRAVYGVLQAGAIGFGVHPSA